MTGNRSASERSSAQQHRDAAVRGISFSVITVSDTRTIETDGSGQLLTSLLTDAGHNCVGREIVRDEVDQIREAVSTLLHDRRQQVIVLTGGTGLSSRDRTPEAVLPLIETEIPGFGELFRMLSYQEIGAAAMLSRAFAGRAANTLVFCLPGSTNAVRLAAEKLLVPELPHLVHHALQTD